MPLDCEGRVAHSDLAARDDWIHSLRACAQVKDHAVGCGNSCAQHVRH